MGGSPSSMTLGVVSLPAIARNVPIPSKHFMEIDENEVILAQEKQANYLRELDI